MCIKAIDIKYVFYSGTQPRGRDNGGLMAANTQLLVHCNWSPTIALTFYFRDCYEWILF